MKIARELGQLFATTFNRRNVNRMAKASGFVKRKSAFDGFDLLLSLSLGRFKKSGQQFVFDSLGHRE